MHNHGKQMVGVFPSGMQKNGQATEFDFPNFTNQFTEFWGIRSEPIVLLVQVSYKDSLDIDF